MFWEKGESAEVNTTEQAQLWNTKQRSIRTWCKCNCRADVAAGERCEPYTLKTYCYWGYVIATPRPDLQKVKGPENIEENIASLSTSGLNLILYL
jgi:hypothetical protein